MSAVESKDIVVAVFGSSIAFAGLLLVFVGLVYSRGETAYSSGRATKYRFIAKLGLVPFVVSAVCSWVCLEWLTSGKIAMYWWSVRLFKADVIGTIMYAVVAVLFFL